MTDGGQFDEWRAALNGKILDPGARGDPASGFFKRNTRLGIEAVAIWRDPGGVIRCKIYSDVQCAIPYETEDVDFIDETVLSSCSRYPISYEIFCAVAYDRKPWPPEYRTRLTLKEIANGTAWTAELGRAKIAAEQSAALARQERIDAASRSRAERGAAREAKRRSKRA